MIDRRVCIAPMMRYSHRHGRYFWRLLCRGALLYTEMTTAEAVVFGGAALEFDPAESPLALQLAGREPEMLARAARRASGFAEINLNCGCPSARVGRGGFGAGLMREPARVADCVAALREASGLPVTVKCRIAVDDEDSASFLDAFAAAVAGADALIVHARRAYLGGLSPRRNRTVPPLDYDRVRQLKRDFPDLSIVINGGIAEAGAVAAHLQDGMDGVMIGRAAIHRPYLLAELAASVFGERPPARAEVFAAMLDYAARHSFSRSRPDSRGRPPARARRHAGGNLCSRALSPLFGLGHGLADARAFRRRVHALITEGRAA